MGRNTPMKNKTDLQNEPLILQTLIMFPNIRNHITVSKHSYKCVSRYTLYTGVYAPKTFIHPLNWSPIRYSSREADDKQQEKPWIVNNNCIYWSPQRTQHRMVIIERPPPPPPPATLNKERQKECSFLILASNIPAHMSLKPDYRLHYSICLLMRMEPR